MSPVGYQEGSEKMWWWKVAMHLDEAQQALANAMAHNLDDPRPVLALQDRLREGQTILLDIFRAKNLLPAVPNGSADGKIEEAIPVEPVPVMSGPAVPDHMIVDAELIDEAQAEVPAEASTEASANESPAAPSEGQPGVATADPAVPPVPEAPSEA